MDNDTLLKVFGTPELVNLFNELSFDVRTKILAVSFKKASKLIISQAQSNLKGYTRVSGSMGDSMKKQEQSLYVGTQRKKGGYLAHIVESGTKERFYKTKEGNLHKTGKITAQHYWSNTLLSSEKEVEDTIYTNIRTLFNEYIQKNNKF